MRETLLGALLALVCCAGGCSAPAPAPRRGLADLPRGARLHEVAARARVAEVAAEDGLRAAERWLLDRGWQVRRAGPGRVQTAWRRAGPAPRLHWERVVVGVEGGGADLTVAHERAADPSALLPAEERARIRAEVQAERCTPPTLPASFSRDRYAAYRRQGWDERTSRIYTARDAEWRERELVARWRPARFKEVAAEVDRRVLARADEELRGRPVGDLARALAQALCAGRAPAP